MKRADSKLMKEINKNLIRNSFRYEIESTATNLAQKTGLSVVTVNGLLKEMVETKEVFLGESRSSNGGRPSTVYIYNDMFRCAVIAFGFTRDNKDYMRFLVTNLLGKCIYEEEFNFENIEYNTFDKTLNSLFDKYKSIEVIAFGLPGTEENGVVNVIDYPGIAGDKFMKHYKERYGVKVIFVNDINAAVNGYYNTKIDNYDDGTVVGLVFNRVYLPGSGLVINGEIHTGKSNFAGEMAYMPLGIDWININYDDEDEITEAISKVIAIFSCVVAPEHFVLYGDFFSENSAKIISEKTRKTLNNYFTTDIVTCNNFEEDYKNGMIKMALEVLNNANKIFE